MAVQVLVFGKQKEYSYNNYFYGAEILIGSFFITYYYRIMPISLNTKTLELLLSHTGYGIGNLYPQKVEIVFIGNESGTAGKSTEEYIDRLLYPDKFKEEPVGASPQKKSPMLQFMNRIRLYSNEPDQKWLLPKSSLQKEDYERILNESCLDSSFQSSTNIHLLDIRPLPRPTESSALNYMDLNSKLYLKAFNSFKPDLNNPYNDWMIKRKDYLIQKIVRFTNLKYIIAAGHIGMKMSFLKELFPEIIFDEHIGKSGKPFFTANIYLNNNKVVVCVCNFLSHQNGIGFNGLKDLTELIFQKTD